MKKQIHRFISITLVVLLLCSTVVSVQAKDLYELDELEIIISAYYVAGTVSNQEKVESVSAEKIIPLYDIRGNVTAYYVYFSNNCYAVVLNNKNNPEALEFGEGHNRAIESLKEKGSGHVIYTCPGEIVSEQEYKKQVGKKDSIIELYDYYTEIKTCNKELASCVQEAKQRILNETELKITNKRGSGGYGFIPISMMPTGGYSYNIVSGTSGVDWADMDDYNDIAHGHCGATTVTNMALLFANRGYSNLKVNNNKRDTFIAVHDIVGNGPQYSIAYDTIDYFEERGYALDFNTVGTQTQYISAIDNDMPCEILLAAGVFDWHWVLGVGYRSYNIDGFFMQVNTNWGTGINTFYKPGGSGAVWIDSSAFEII
ncbi:MAG: hypothetical protein J5739_07075 [Lachnospiraceae bacterium]|nr:hypothetical protein [Lachnospiraceae bacterium]